MTSSKAATAAAVFSPQSSAPKTTSLAYFRRRLIEEPLLQPLADAVANLPETWHTLASVEQDVATIKDAPHLVQSFPEWLKTGESEVLEQSMTGLITLPLLVAIHIIQYLDYLQQAGISHSEFLASVESGGIQGYCIGLLSAVLIACSKDEQDVVQNAVGGVRLALGIGSFGDRGRASSDGEPNTLAIRVRNPGDEKEILRKFPGAYISTITDPKTMSIIAPAGRAAELKAYAESQGLRPKIMHIRSNLHNSANEDLAKICTEIFEGSLFLTPDLLQAPIRSNRTGAVLDASTLSLTQEVITTVLASQCDWSLVITNLAEDLKRSGREHHSILLFGVGDSVPMGPFQQQGLDVSKVDVLSTMNISTTAAGPSSTLESFPPDAIAIVGAGCRLPGASSLDELWEVISQGQSRLEKLRTERFNLKESYRASQDPDWVKKREFFGNFVDDIDAFDNTFFGISPREAKYMDPQQRLLLETAFEAMDSSGYLRHHQRDRGDKVGCFLGASYTEYLENTSAYTPSAFTATSTIRAFLSGKISYHFGWTGPSEVIDTACSASIVAVHRACRAINAGECPIALAGGVNIITGINNYFDLGKASFLSQTGQCKPFDDSADGYCRADGVGLVVLKSLSQAVSDGDHIMGVIPAVATNQGGIGAPGITVPDGILQKRLYGGLLKKSGIPAKNVSYVEAHGTGTQVGDPIEIGSIREVFGSPKRTSPLYLGSLKANVGHSETAAGVGSLIKVLAMMRHGGIPPLQGFKRLNHKIPPLEFDKMAIPTKLVPWECASEPRVACINSYGASGSNSALLCSEWLEDRQRSTLSSRISGQEYPILLSAASASSLQRYATDLAAYITKAGADVTLGNLSYTLSQRRKHHRVRWSTTASDLKTLGDQLRICGPEDFVQAPQTTKKIVLVFSGQSRTTIGVDPMTRQENPRFVQYIQTCNQILMSFGCPDIIPALSQQEPILDPTVLQCGTVAVQYACAQCWIDGGLQVDGIVGHSLGELTALAVSGALSLEDALRVVYTRAELIKAKWGSERGTMLAIHANVETVRSIMDIVESTINNLDEALEIACYNSITSHIVVGKEASISVAERIIQQDPRYQGLRYQRLQTSHGFHSRFTEPLLQDLSYVESIITFKEPKIPLETCTPTQMDFGNKSTSRYLANHARDSVYFVDAVRRIEKRLGSVVWLEAGWNTPIAAMTKRAVANPSMHTFQPVTSAATVAVELWREGIATTYWSYFTPKESGLKAVWLPPYSFDRPKYWLDHVDRAMEERKAAELAAMQGDKESTKRIQQLVTYKGVVGTSHQFDLHTTTERFKKIVQGHAVRQKPLCPASMYMEAAIMGIELLNASAKDKTITFENVVFNRPLGCDDNLDVQLKIYRDPSDEESFHYAVHSSGKAAHSEGDFNAAGSGKADLQLYEMLVADQMKALQNDTSAERLRTATAYSLFSRVVEYSDVMRGISSITLGTKQALAQIKVPKTQFAARESTVTGFYDAISLDTFIQVLGLLINCSTGSSADDEIYVASSIGKMVVSPTDFDKAQNWTVYATYSNVDSKTSSGAVFVFGEDGKLTSFATKIQFMRIQAAKLERVLESANPGSAVTSAVRPVMSAQPVSNVATQPSVPSSVLVPVISGPAPAAGSGDSQAKAAELKSLISVYTGVAVEDMQNDQTFGEMGLDSLASMELADEIESKVGLVVQTEDLLIGTIGSLMKLLPSDGGAAGSGASSPSIGPQSDDTCSESSDSIRDSTGIHTSMPVTPAEDYLVSKPGDPIDRSIPWLRPKSSQSSRFKVETMNYKEADGVQIPADLYIPQEAPATPMPVALMIHGGGHLTLSRRAVRPTQTKHLLANGIFPVSIDYRLCPQVNVIDGPMADVRDACEWVQRDLPKIMAARGIEIDASKYVVIGWSTGGTLAMTTAWSLSSANIRPPAAILSFYCPVNYDPEAPILMGDEHNKRTMTLSEIRKLMSSRPDTSHAFNSLDTTKLGWVHAGDPRSELTLALIKEERGMSLLFNDLPADCDDLPYPNAARAAAFSPLQHVLHGDYNTPTYLIFGDEDEIAPFGKAVEFAQALQDHGVKSGFLPVRGAKHIFDLGLNPGSDGWNNCIGPGYDFIIQELEDAHRRLP